MSHQSPSLHLNPSRTKIAMSFKKSTPKTGFMQSEQKILNQNEWEQNGKGNPISRPLFFEELINDKNEKWKRNDRKYLQQQNQRVYLSSNKKYISEEQYNGKDSIRKQNLILRQQIRRLETINLKLIDKLEKKDCELLRINKQYRQFLKKYNQQLITKRKSISTYQYPTYFTGSKIQQVIIVTSVDGIHSDKQQTTKCSKTSTKRKNSQSYQQYMQNRKKSLLKLKQNFERLDFREIQEIAKLSCRTTTGKQENSKQDEI